MIKLMKEYISKKLIDYCLINTNYDQQNVVQKDSYKTLSSYGFHTRKNSTSFITNIIPHYSLQTFLCQDHRMFKYSLWGESTSLLWQICDKRNQVFCNNLLNNTRNKILYNIGLYLCIFTHDSGDLYCSPYHCQHSCTSKKCLRA